MSDEQGQVAREDVSTWVHSPRLHVTMHPDGDALRIALVGELDVAAIGALAAVPPASDAPTLVLDLRGLHFLDAAGLRALLTLVDRGHRVTLQGTSRLVDRILAITDTAAQFVIESG